MSSRSRPSKARIASLEQANRAVAHATQENTVSVTDLHSEVEKQVTAHEEPKLTRAQKTEIEQTELANTPRYDAIQDSEQVDCGTEAAGQGIRVPRLHALRPRA